MNWRKTLPLGCADTAEQRAAWAEIERLRAERDAAIAMLRPRDGERAEKIEQLRTMIIAEHHHRAVQCGRGDCCCHCSVCEAAVLAAKEEGEPDAR